MGPPAQARVGRGTSHRRRRTARDQALHRVTHRGAPLALHLRTRAAAHAAIRELPRRRGSQPRWIAAGASAHAAPLLWIRAGQPRLRPSIDPRLPWPPRSQAHRPLHARCGRALRKPLALILSVFTLSPPNFYRFEALGIFSQPVAAGETNSCLMSRSFAYCHHLTGVNRVLLSRAGERRRALES